MSIVKDINEDSLIKLKHKLISSWLFLAIDIQGLSEVDESKRKNYLTDIYNSTYKNQSYFKYLLVDYLNKMVKQNFKLDYNNSVIPCDIEKNKESVQSILDENNNKNKSFEVYFSDYDIGLNKEYNAVEENSSLIIFINQIEQLSQYLENKDSINDFMIKFIHKSDLREFFFPHWLQLLSKQFDKLINEFNNKK